MTAVSPDDVDIRANDSEAAAIGLGEAFVRAVVGRDFDAVEALLAPDVRFRALTPRAVREGATASETRGWIERWFGETDQNQLLESRVEMVADRLHVAYRVRLREDGAWHIVEQQLFGSVSDARLTDVSLLCSGFRTISNEPHADARLDAIGRDCATLTPDIRAAVRQLEPGQVLEIVTDDPTAEDGLRAWSRLTGNEVVDVRKASDAAGYFYVRRGPASSPQASTTGAKS